MKGPLGLIGCALGVCAAVAVLAGCGSPMQLGHPEVMPQAAALPIQSSQIALPNAACPAAGGKLYKTGNGHVSMKFWPVEIPVGSSGDWQVFLYYTGWPEHRDLVRYTTKLLTCGPDGSKKPLGQLGTCCGGGRIESCRNGLCKITLILRVPYKIMGKLPGRKPWKYDYVQFVPAKPQRGFGGLPSLRIQVNP